MLYRLEKLFAALAITKHIRTNMKQFPISLDMQIKTVINLESFNQICKLRKDKHGWYVKFPRQCCRQVLCVIDMDLGKMDLHEQKLKEVRLIPNRDFIA